MKHIHTGDSIDITIKTLVSGGPDRLVVSVSHGTVADVSADGCNRALADLTALLIETQQAIEALIGVRHHIEQFRAEDS